jgi:hypothetical protein
VISRYYLFLAGLKFALELRANPRGFNAAINDIRLVDVVSGLCKCAEDDGAQRLPALSCGIDRLGCPERYEWGGKGMGPSRPEGWGASLTAGHASDLGHPSHMSALTAGAHHPPLIHNLMHSRNLAVA